MVTLALATGFLLILIGVYGALTNRNIIRMIVAFSVANVGVNIVLVAVGYLPGKTAPIVDGVVTVANAGEMMVDPLPQALVLTAIVIGLGITTLMLAFAYKLYEKHGSLDIAKFSESKW